MAHPATGPDEPTALEEQRGEQRHELLDRFGAARRPRPDFPGVAAPDPLVPEQGGPGTPGSGSTDLWAPTGTSRAGDRVTDDGSRRPTPLVASPHRLLRALDQVQRLFVDDPRRAVDEAGILLATALESIRTSAGTAEDATGTAATEELRIVLLRHREIVTRLLGA